MKTRRNFNLLRLAAAILVLAAAACSAPKSHIVVMHSNDIHGHLLPENSVGGAAMMAAIVKNVNPDLLLDAGDMFTGTLISDSFAGEPIIAVMNHLGYRATTLGNHEFDYGLGPLQARAQQAKFPLLSANVVLPFDEVGKTTVLTINGIRVGIVGLTTEETPQTTHPKNLGRVRFLSIIESLESVVPELRKQSDFIIAIAHLRAEEETAVARAFPEIGLIVGGHESQELRSPLLERRTLIQRTGRFARYVGQVDIDFNNKVATNIAAKLIPVEGVAPDPEVLAIIEPYRLKVDTQLRTVLGESTAPMPDTSDAESSLANLISDAFRAKTGTDVVIMNIGGVRSDLPAGQLTYGDLFEVLPFENTLVTLRLTGAQLRRSLAMDIAPISGVRAVFDLSKPRGQRLVSATLADGSSIVDTATYSVTINDFMQAGGDGYVEFANGREIVDTGMLLRDVVGEYITTLRTVRPSLDGRVRVVN